MAKFGLKVWYHGDRSSALDKKIKDVALPGTWWAQGYDFGEDIRDIVFDFNTVINRDMAIVGLESINGVHAEPC